MILSIARILRETKYGVTGLISENTEAFYAELNKKAEAVTISYSVRTDFLQIFILCLWLRPIRRSDQGVKFMNFPSQRFLMISIMVSEKLYRRKIICGCFGFIWLWLLIAVMKTCERCALQLYRTSLKKQNKFFAAENSSYFFLFSQNQFSIKYTKFEEQKRAGENRVLVDFFCYANCRRC